MDPVRKYSYHQVWIGRVIGLKVQPKIVKPSHLSVHHEGHLYFSFFSRLKNHRTDGRSRRSTTLLQLNKWRFAENQVAAASVFNQHRGMDPFTQAHISVIEKILVD